MVNRRDFLKSIGIIIGTIPLWSRPIQSSEKDDTEIIDKSRLDLGLPWISKISDLESATLKFQELIPEKIFQKARGLGYIPREQVQIFMNDFNAGFVFERFNSLTRNYSYAIMTTERDGEKLSYKFYELKDPIKFNKIINR